MFSRKARAARERAVALERADDEVRCRFVSSKGLMKCCEVHQPLPNHAATEWPRRALKRHQQGGRIYVHATALADFVKRALPRIRAPFVLVSGDSVPDVSGESLGEGVVARVLEHPHLIRWHSQNLAMTHPKVEAMPLGLDYHTIALRGRPEWGPAASPRAQEELLQTIRRMARPLAEREVLGYSNWQFRPQNGDRAKVIETIPRAACFFEAGELPRSESWVRNSGYFFTISPRGVGMDCHRTWEAILLGSVPVIDDLPINGLFETLPVVVVKDWARVTPEFLAAERERILGETFDFAPVFLETWRRRLFGEPEVGPMRMSFQEFVDLTPAEMDAVLTRK